MTNTEIETEYTVAYSEYMAAKRQATPRYIAITPSSSYWREPTNDDLVRLQEARLRYNIAKDAKEALQNQ